MITVLGYVPFLEPINGLQSWWYLLLVPLAIGISMIYKAMKMQRLDHYWRHVILMTAQIVAAMIALAIGLAILVQWLIPMIPV